MAHFERAIALTSGGTNPAGLAEAQLGLAQAQHELE